MLERLSVNRQNVLLLMQVALLGTITPSIRGITVEWCEDRIHGLFLFDGDITDEDRDNVNAVEGELYSHFTDCDIHFECERYDYPNVLHLKTLKAWVYSRWEDYSDPKWIPKKNHKSLVQKLKKWIS